MYKKKENSSWEDVSSWYNKVVGSKGHYYHENVIMPKLVKLLQDNTCCKSLLDLACGQGVVSRLLDKEIDYTGVDASSSLIQTAKKLSKNKHHQFHVFDLTDKLNLVKKDFDACTIVLALQNIADPLQVMKNAAAHLKQNAQFIIVLNHPCFRIPRQTAWQIDEEKKIQYRRIDRYMSSMKIPIQAHPSQGQGSKETLSFHYNISDLSKMLKQSGFCIELIDEWVSDKKSTGSKARMENRSREEIPMFMTIIARKL